MRDHTVIDATFSDYRTVKSRSVLQLILEVPIERQADVFAALGFPMPSAPVWCAVVRLKDKPGDHATPQPVKAPSAAPVAARERYRLGDKGEQAVQRAGILAKDEQFQEWLRYSERVIGSCDEAKAADYIRAWCMVGSRREIASDPDALRQFEQLETNFLIAVGRLPSPDGIPPESPGAVRSQTPRSPLGSPPKQRPSAGAQHIQGDDV